MLDFEMFFFFAFCSVHSDLCVMAESVSFVTPKLKWLQGKSQIHVFRKRFAIEYSFGQSSNQPNQ